MVVELDFCLSKRLRDKKRLTERSCMRVVTLEDIVRGRARMGGGWLGG